MAVNDITGASLVTKATTQAYRDNFDRIFNKGKSEEQLESSSSTSEETEDGKEKVQDS